MKKRFWGLLVLVLLAMAVISHYDLIPSNKEAQAQSRPILYWGTSGANVRLVQSRLQQWGYYKGAVDGIFGTATSQAVKQFQARNGLTADGIVGPATWRALGFNPGTGGGSGTVSAQAQGRPTLYWGSRGANVRLVQWKLQEWGYYRGAIDGIFGNATAQAVRQFQARNGLRVDGLVGPATWRALGLGTGQTTTPRTQQVTYRAPVSTNNDLNLLARVIAAEAEGEPYKGQAAVGAVIMNRVRSPQFPNSLSGVIYQPHAFESVTNGLIWRRTPDQTAISAARDALNGYDPTYGCLFFWNPSKPISSKWIWSRPIVTQIGSHVFAR